MRCSTIKGIASPCGQSSTYFSLQHSENERTIIPSPPRVFVSSFALLAYRPFADDKADASGVAGVREQDDHARELLNKKKNEDCVMK